MTYASAPCYWLTCDFPGCDSKSTDTGDYGAQFDTASAEADADREGWTVLRSKSPNGHYNIFAHYCRRHTPTQIEDVYRPPVPHPQELDEEEWVPWT